MVVEALADQVPLRNSSSEHASTDGDSLFELGPTVWLGALDAGAIVVATFKEIVAPFHRGRAVAIVFPLHPGDVWATLVECAQ